MKCSHRSTVYGICILRSKHKGPHQDRFGVRWTVNDKGLTMLVRSTDWMVERLRREVHDRTGQRPIRWLAEVCVEDAEAEMPMPDYSVDRPDVLDSEREDAVYQEALIRIMTVLVEDELEKVGSLS